VTVLPDWLPEDIDPTIPSSARVYDYILGGFNNFEADRVLADRIAANVPGAVEGARANRAFLRRAVTFLVAEAGITQFLDLGSGIPTAGNVHEVAQLLDPEVRVAYVDIDPVAVSMGKKALADNPHATAIRGDLLDVEKILADPEITGLIDFTRPVAVLVLSVLHFVPDEADPGAIIARIGQELIPGSFLAISHFCSGGGPPGLTERAVNLSRQMPTASTPRSQAGIEGLFDGFDILDPGVVDVASWRPDESRARTAVAAPVWLLGGVATNA